MPGTEQYRTVQAKKKMLKALAENGMIIGTACRACGVGRQTYYSWIKDDPDFKKQVDELGELDLDLAEQGLQHHLKEKNMTAIIFTLKYKGRSRGYTQRKEVVDKSTVRDELDAMSDAELEELLANEMERRDGYK
jgi:hypothetical protein